MWATIGEHLPRMKRDDPTTWCDPRHLAVPPRSIWYVRHRFVTDEESERLTKSGGKDPFFSARATTYTVRNGAEQLLLDMAVRPMWPIAEQLLGEGTITECRGEDENGMTHGPVLINDDAVENLQSHMGDKMGWPVAGTFETEHTLALPKTGPIWLNGQGTRGIYATLPSEKAADFKPSGHSDGPVYGSWRLQMMAYFDDVPPESGAFTGALPPLGRLLAAPAELSVAATSVAGLAPAYLGGAVEGVRGARRAAHPQPAGRHGEVRVVRHVRQHP